MTATGALIIFLYLLVGLFIWSVISEIGDMENDYITVVLLWPLVIVGIVFVIFLSIPVALGKLIGTLIKNFMR